MCSVHEILYSIFYETRAPHCPCIAWHLCAGQSLVCFTVSRHRNVWQILLYGCAYASCIYICVKLKCRVGDGHSGIQQLACAPAPAVPFPQNDFTQISNLLAHTVFLLPASQISWSEFLGGTNLECKSQLPDCLGLPRSLARNTGNWTLHSRNVSKQRLDFHLSFSGKCLPWISNLQCFFLISWRFQVIQPQINQSPTALNGPEVCLLLPATSMSRYWFGRCICRCHGTIWSAHALKNPSWWPLGMPPPLLSISQGKTENSMGWHLGPNPGTGNFRSFLSCSTPIWIVHMSKWWTEKPESMPLVHSLVVYASCWLAFWVRLWEPFKSVVSCTIGPWYSPELVLSWDHNRPAKAF